MRERTFEGHWWLPERPEEQIAGIVTYDGSEPSLRLLGAFRSKEEKSPGSFSVEAVKHAPVILGRCEGKAVTLLDCGERRFNMRFTSSLDDWRQTLAARLMLVGIWLDEPGEEYFDQMAVGIDHLLAWSRQSGLVRQLEQTDGRWTSTTARWEQPDPFTATVAGATVELQLSCVTNEGARADRMTSSLEEHAHLSVTVPEPRSAEALIKQWTKPLQDIVTLAMDTPCGLHDITLIRRNPPTDPETEVAGRPARPVVVEAYLSPVYRARPDDKAVPTNEALFTLDDLPFVELLPAWFDLNERLGPVVAMLLGQRYIKRSFTETKLITAVAAAEGLHRRLLPDKAYLPSEQFEAMTTALVGTVAPEQSNDQNLWMALGEVT